MMNGTMVPGDTPVSLNEARGWLRMEATVDDAVIAGLIRAATNVCEAFIGRWLIVRAAEEEVVLRAGVARLGIRPVVGIDAVTLLTATGGETALDASDYRLSVGEDGTARLAPAAAGIAGRLRVRYRAGLAAESNAIPEAIRQGIVRLVQHLHEARDGAGAAPPAAVAALWQPWRRVGLGGAA